MYIIDLVKIANQIETYDSSLASQIDDAARKLLYAEQRQNHWIKIAKTRTTLKLIKEQFHEIVPSFQSLKKVADQLEKTKPSIASNINRIVQAGLYDFLDRMSNAVLRSLPGQTGKNERVLNKVETLANMAQSNKKDLTKQVQELDTYLKREIPRDQYIRKFGQNVLKAIHDWWQAGKNNQVLYNGLRFALTGFDPSENQIADDQNQQQANSQAQLLQLIEEFMLSNQNVADLWNKFLFQKQQSQSQ